MAPPLLQLLVDRLGFAAAELSVRDDDGANVGAPHHWLVKAVVAAPGRSPSGPPEHASGPYCSSDQAYPLEGNTHAILRTHSFAPEPLADAVQRFLRSVGQQIGQFISAKLPTTVPRSNVSQRNADERRMEAYQERLRSLTADLLLVEERERRQLALDLHDGLSQTIALVKIRIAALELGATRAQANSLREIGLLIEQANHAARSVSFELSPPVLHDLGLEPALEWLAENISARYGLQVVFEDDARSKPTDDRTRIIVFRSIRELLINAAKHSKAQVVRVELKRVGHDLQATVADDGVGMEPALEQVPGSGLFSIRERLRHVGGDISIASAPGLGTSIQLRARIADDARRELSPRRESDARHTTNDTRSAAPDPGLETRQGVKE
jgi:signal transduction histidine kinase